MLFFRKKLKKIQPCEFTWTLENDTILLQLKQNDQCVMLEMWAQKTDKTSFDGVTLVLGELESQGDLPPEEQQLFQIDDATVRLLPTWVASLSNTQAQWLKLPTPLPFSLNIDHKGTLDQEEFRFDYQWQRPNGQVVLSSQRQGALLTVGTQLYRITEPYFSLVTGMDAFNNAPPEDVDIRFLAWAKISNHMPHASMSAIQTTGYLSNTKIVHASAFTLDIQEVDGEFTFDPLLIKPPSKDETGDEAAELPTEPNVLLSDAHQDLFNQRFRATSNARPRYVLRDGWYVVVDDHLQEALQVVHTMQQRPHIERRAFAKNPRAYLRQALGEKVSDEVLENLFVETLAYSQRVTDIGLWEQKNLPLVKQETETWLPPEAMGPDGVGAARSEGEDSVSDEDGRQKITLQIEDNLTEVNFSKAEWQPRDPAPELGVPTCMKSTPKPHQETGLEWMQKHWRSGSPGGLLADDMGLGKTFQSLAFLVWLKEGMRAGLMDNLPILIVAPTGLLKNWEQEHGIHFNEPGLGSLQRAYGEDLRALRLNVGEELTKGLPLLDKEKMQNADWLLTTYETLRDYQHSFGALHFGAIVFDEVQKIKTPGTLMTEAAKAMHTEFILAMTGTPIENRLSDLWCLIDTVCPGYLGDLKSFSQFYEKDKDNMYSLKAQLTEKMHGNTPPIMLRRMKEDHLTGFPEIEFHLLPEDCADGSMAPYQASLYGEVVRRQGDAEAKPGLVLEALQQLRMISLHPLAIRKPDDEDSKEIVLDDEFIEQSARIATTFKLLDEIKEKDEKVLIFLESQVMQRYLMTLIQRRYEVQPMLINGSVNGAKRQTRVNTFQQKEGFDVFIISPLAGGVGLTLTAANHVIHLTRWWNPAVEDQCTCRAYRLGQQKPVHVYYPLAIHPEFQSHSFDWRLHNLLDGKRTLSRDMLLPPAAKEEDMMQLYEETRQVEGA